MAKFTVDPISIDPEEYLDRCSTHEIVTLLDLLRDEHTYEYEKSIQISPGDFLDKCSTGELKETHDMLHEDYDIGNEKDDVDLSRSESFKVFVSHLNSLKESWYSITSEDTEIISKIAKKYGAV